MPWSSVSPTDVARDVQFASVRAASGAYHRRQAEAHRIEDGDILVCDMSTPAWTPHFASLGAIGAGSGGSLSHGALVPREYGVPSVVGTRIGSRVIPDGARTTVDGGQGLVRLEG